MTSRLRYQIMAYTSGSSQVHSGSRRQMSALSRDDRAPKETADRDQRSLPLDLNPQSIDCWIWALKYEIETLERINGVRKHLGEDVWKQWCQWMRATDPSSFDSLSAETFTVLRDAVFGRPSTPSGPAKAVTYDEMDMELFFWAGKVDFRRGSREEAAKNRLACLSIPVCERLPLIQLS